MNHKEKIIHFLDTINERHSDFCKKCGFSSNFLKSGKYFGTDKLVEIMNNYANLNLDWLLFDKGEMLLKTYDVFDDVTLDATQEHEKKYSSSIKEDCNCEEKDKQIAQLQDHIHTLKIVIEKLK